MISCKKIIILTCLTICCSWPAWSEAPVVDDSENFAVMEGQQFADEANDARPRFDEPQDDNAGFDAAQSDEGPALAKDDQVQSTKSNASGNATLLDKILSLQQEIQELRGQLEIQAHDLKLLQQQQLSFYKDLDARLSTVPSGKSAQATAPLELGAVPATNPSKPAQHTVNTSPKSAPSNTMKPVVAAATSRANPADEQIGYMAAYELVKDKRYDDAISAMSTFVQKYPKGGYTANAEYWLGELYLVKKDSANALEHFEAVLQKFPASSKSAASLLKSGYAYAAQGNQEEAKKRFQKVISTYPDTPTAQLAQSKLDAIRTL